MVNRFSRRHASWRGMALVLVSGLFLAACADNPPPGDPDDTSGGVSTGQGNGSVETREINERGLLGIDEKDRAMFVDPDNPLSTRTIYFEYDSSTIQSRFRDAIQAHAGYLADHPDVQLRLEGHTDERATREYNVALGERRAESVERALSLAGAGSDQLSTLSFGEERPAELGSTESAYAKNRRVELIYVAR